MKFDYHDVYKKYDMSGEIHIGTGIVKVHDIFDPIPEFMLQADALFCDPPCSNQNLSSFYTKAEKDKRTDDFADFRNRLFEVIEEINPKYLFLEVFKSNREAFFGYCKEHYKNVRIFDSMYYGNPRNVCYIIMASNEDLPNIDFAGLDEEYCIEKICKNVDFECIADPCMGKGLVGFYANKHKKKFVGTELNYKRLAVCVERVTTGRRGNIN